MERHYFDHNQPQGSMSLMNLRNSLRALFQGDIMPLRPRASFVLDDMEYATDSQAQSAWSGAGCAVTHSLVKQEGNFALQVVIDATPNRQVTRIKALDLSGFKEILLWERCSGVSQAFRFFLEDGSGHVSYWLLTSHATANTWKQDILNLAVPDGNNGTPAVLSNITDFGFYQLPASQTFIFDTIKARCGMSVAIDSCEIGSFYKQAYIGGQPISMTAKSSPVITAPAANPRIDILVVNSAGTLSWVVGTEAANPVPNWTGIPSARIPICLVYCKNTMSKVVDYEDKDANPNEGFIYSDIRPLYWAAVSNLSALSDVSISGLANNHVLRYNSTSGKWENKTPRAVYA